MKTKHLLTMALVLTMLAGKAQTIEYNPANSPDLWSYSWSSNSYTDAGWTTIEVTQDKVITSVSIAFTWSTNYSWSGNGGSFYLKSPDNTTETIAQYIEYGDYDETLDGFNGKNMSGTWQLWITDDNYEGAYQATDITLTFTYLDVPNNPNPSNNAQNINLAGNLTWDFTDGVQTYDVWLGPTGNMVEVVSGATASGSNGSYAYTGLDYNTAYNWQVIEHHAGDVTKTGPVWSFTTTLNIAQNPSPANNAQNISITSILNWDDVYGASSYTIDIGTSSGSSDIVNDGACATSDYSNSEHWVPGSTYYWTVSSIIGGSPVTGTEWHFTTLDGFADNPVPANNSYVSGTVTLLNWDDMPQASGYTINVGTTPGGTDIADDVSCETSEYAYPSGFSPNMFVYWNVSCTVDGITYQGDNWLFRTALPDNEVTSLADLSIVSQFTGLWSLSLTQTADIDASATQYWDYSDDNGDGDRYNDPNDLTSAGTNDGWSPIGNSTTPFSGNYDGQTHSISNLYMHRSADYQGFFGNINGPTGPKSSITNLGIANITIYNSGNTYYTGGLAGKIAYTIVNHCYSSGNIEHNYWYAGGLIGQCYPTNTITNSYSSVDITGEANGFLLRSGCFIGECGFTTVNACYSTGSINNLYSFGGGFIGFVSTSSSISNCYSTGNVSRDIGSTDNRIGAFTGYHAGTKVEKSYATGSVSYLGTSNPTDRGFIAYGSNPATNNFFNTSTSGQTTAIGATAINNAQMRTESTFTDAAWDFVGESTNGDYNYWSIGPTFNNGYPTLNGISGSIVTWNGAVSNSWNNAGNWSNNIIPFSGDNVVISNSGFQPVITSGSGISCNNLTVNTGATLTMNSGGSLITNGSIVNNGTIDIEKSISESQWHLISSPVAGATSSIFDGDYLQIWDETTGSWSDITQTGYMFEQVVGYSLWATPDKSQQIYTFSGTPNTGSINKSMSHTALTGSEYDGANLLGNPYPSSIDWNGLRTTYGAVYYWNGSAYVSWNVSGSGSQYIPPMQGFFIVAPANGTFSLTNANRTHSGATSFYKSTMESNLSNGLVLTASNGTYNDDLWLVLKDQASENFELQNDAWKLKTSTPGISQLWSVCPDGNLSIDVRPYQETIQLGFANDQAGINTISLNEIADITNAILEDTKTAIFHDLLQGDYEFMWELSDDEMRFKLHLKAVGIEETPISESNILIYAANNQFFIKGAEAGEIMVSDVMGRVVLRQEINGDETISIPANLQTGVYVVIVRNGEKVKTEKVFIN